MFLYKAILRRRAAQWRKAPGAAVPTVCVGNITVGGTGKTPHTELIIRLLTQAGGPSAASLGAQPLIYPGSAEAALSLCFERIPEPRGFYPAYGGPSPEGGAKDADYQ